MDFGKTRRNKKKDKDEDVKFICKNCCGQEYLNYLKEVPVEKRKFLETCCFRDAYYRKNTQNESENWAKKCKKVNKKDKQPIKRNRVLSSPKSSHKYNKSNMDNEQTSENSWCTERRKPKISRKEKSKRCSRHKILPFSSSQSDKKLPSIFSSESNREIFNCIRSEEFSENSERHRKCTKRSYKENTKTKNMSYNNSRCTGCLEKNFPVYSNRQRSKNAKILSNCSSSSMKKKIKTQKRHNVQKYQQDNKLNKRQPNIESRRNYDKIYSHFSKNDEFSSCSSEEETNCVSLQSPTRTRNGNNSKGMKNGYQKSTDEVRKKLRVEKFNKVSRNSEPRKGSKSLRKNKYKLLRQNEVCFFTGNSESVCLRLQSDLSCDLSKTSVCSSSSSVVTSVPQSSSENERFSDFNTQPDFGKDEKKMEKERFQTESVESTNSDVTDELRRKKDIRRQLLKKKCFEFCHNNVSRYQDDGYREIPKKTRDVSVEKNCETQDKINQSGTNDKKKNKKGFKSRFTCKKRKKKDKVSDGSESGKEEHKKPKLIKKSRKKNVGDNFDSDSCESFSEKCMGKHNCDSKTAITYNKYYKSFKNCAPNAEPKNKSQKHKNIKTQTELFGDTDSSDTERQDNNLDKNDLEGRISKIVKKYIKANERRRLPEPCSSSSEGENSGKLKNKQHKKCKRDRFNCSIREEMNLNKSCPKENRNVNRKSEIPRMYSNCYFNCPSVSVSSFERFRNNRPEWYQESDIQESKSSLHSNFRNLQLRSSENCYPFLITSRSKYYLKTDKPGKENKGQTSTNKNKFKISDSGSNCNFSSDMKSKRNGKQIVLPLSSSCLELRLLLDYQDEKNTKDNRIFQKKSPLKCYRSLNSSTSVADNKLDSDNFDIRIIKLKKPRRQEDKYNCNCNSFQEVNLEKKCRNRMSSSSLLSSQFNCEKVDRQSPTLNCANENKFARNLIKMKSSSCLKSRVRADELDNTKKIIIGSHQGTRNKYYRNCKGEIICCFLKDTTFCDGPFQKSDLTRFNRSKDKNIKEFKHKCVKIMHSKGFNSSVSLTSKNKFRSHVFQRFFWLCLLWCKALMKCKASYTINGGNGWLTWPNYLTYKENREKDYQGKCKCLTTCVKSGTNIERKLDCSVMGCRLRGGESKITEDSENDSDEFQEKEIEEEKSYLEALSQLNMDYDIKDEITKEEIDKKLSQILPFSSGIRSCQYDAEIELKSTNYSDGVCASSSLTYLIRDLKLYLFHQMVQKKSEKCLTSSSGSSSEYLSKCSTESLDINQYLTRREKERKIIEKCCLKRCSEKSNVFYEKLRQVANSTKFNDETLQALKRKFWVNETTLQKAQKVKSLAIVPRSFLLTNLEEMKLKRYQSCSEIDLGDNVVEKPDKKIKPDDYNDTKRFTDAYQFKLETQQIIITRPRNEINKGNLNDDGISECSMIHEVNEFENSLQNRNCNLINVTKKFQQIKPEGLHYFPFFLKKYNNERVLSNFGENSIMGEKKNCLDSCTSESLHVLGNIKQICVDNCSSCCDFEISEKQNECTQGEERQIEAYPCKTFKSENKPNKNFKTDDKPLCKVNYSVIPKRFKKSKIKNKNCEHQLSKFRRNYQRELFNYLIEKSFSCGKNKKKIESKTNKVQTNNMEIQTVTTRICRNVSQVVQCEFNKENQAEECNLLKTRSFNVLQNMSLVKNDEFRCSKSSHTTLWSNSGPTKNQSNLLKRTEVQFADKDFVTIYTRTSSSKNLLNTTSFKEDYYRKGYEKRQIYKEDICGNKIVFDDDYYFMKQQFDERIARRTKAHVRKCEFPSNISRRMSAGVDHYDSDGKNFDIFQCNRFKKMLQKSNTTQFDQVQNEGTQYNFEGVADDPILKKCDSDSLIKLQRVKKCFRSNEKVSRSLQVVSRFNKSVETLNTAERSRNKEENLKKNEETLCNLGSCSCSEEVVLGSKLKNQKLLRLVYSSDSETDNGKRNNVVTPCDRLKNNKNFLGGKNKCYKKLIVKKGNENCRVVLLDVDSTEEDTHKKTRHSGKLLKNRENNNCKPKRHVLDENQKKKTLFNEMCRRRHKNFEKYVEKSSSNTSTESNARLKRKTCTRKQREINPKSKERFGYFATNNCENLEGKRNFESRKMCDKKKLNFCCFKNKAKITTDQKSFDSKNKCDNVSTQTTNSLLCSSLQGTPLNPEGLNQPFPETDVNNKALIFRGNFPNISKPLCSNGFPLNEEFLPQYYACFSNDLCGQYEFDGSVLPTGKISRLRKNNMNEDTLFPGPTNKRNYKLFSRQEKCEPRLTYQFFSNCDCHRRGDKEIYNSKDFSENDNYIDCCSRRRNQAESLLVENDLDSVYRPSSICDLCRKVIKGSGSRCRKFDRCSNSFRKCFKNHEGKNCITNNLKKKLTEHVLDDLDIKYKENRHLHNEERRYGNTVNRNKFRKKAFD